MAVGEEAVLLPTHASRCPQSGKGYHATSQRARRVAIGSLMLLMSCALVGTLSHVSAGARYYGMQAAHKQAAATQQVTLCALSPPLIHASFMSAVQYVLQTQDHKQCSM